MGAGRVLTNVIGIPLLATSVYFAHNYMGAMNKSAESNPDVSRSIILKERIDSYNGPGRESDSYKERVIEYNGLLKRSGEDIERFHDQKTGFAVTSTLSLALLIGLVEANSKRRRSS